MNKTVQFSHSRVSDSLKPHGLQNARPLCPSPTPGVYSDSCSLSWRCHQRISSSVIPFSSCLQSFPIRVFSNESVLPIRWPKYCSFSFSINPSNEYSGLISFRMDWLDLLAVQGTLKNLLQHHSSKASVRELCIRLLYSCIFSIVSSLAVSSTFLGLMWLYVQGAFGGLCPGVVE